MITVFDVPNMQILGSKEDPLQRMFQQQKTLMTAYLKRGRLPEFPLLTLTTREGQNFMRDLIGFCTEEIFEAFDELELIALGIERQAGQGELILILHKYNEELADIMHFMLEILVYLNIDYEDVDGYYGRLLQERALQSLYNSTSILANALSYANYANIQEGFKIQAIKMSNYNLLPDDKVENAFQQAGRYISINNLEEYRNLLFNMMKSLNKVRCLMKNKYWKDESTAQPNTEMIHLYAMEAFLYWMCYLDLTGATESSISQTYYKKHMVNLDRLENGY